MKYYVVVEFPDVQYIMDAPGFDDNSYPIYDDYGIRDFGSGAYFVSVEWLESIGYIKK